MPNWCENGATLLHNDPAMLERVRTAFQHERLFQEFVPLQDGLEGGEYCAAGNENWGTKWDATCHDIDEREGGIFLVFDTAWTPPIQFYEKLAELGFSINAYYFEPGCGFCGRYTHDEGDDYYEIEEADAEWVRDVIPRDIDSFFGISDMMIDNEQYEEEQEKEYEVADSWHSTKTILKDENGEAFIEFTDAEMKSLGWKEGDTIVWTNNGNGTFTLSKKEDNEHLQSEV